MDINTDSDPAQRPERQKREFGGAPGALLIMGVSHLLVYYLWIAQTYYRGALVRPDSVADILPFLGRMGRHVVEGAAPTAEAAAVYLGFVLLQALLAATLPGVWARGMPVPTEGNVRHRYLCNGVASWYVTLALVAVLHVSGVFRLGRLADLMGPMLTVAILVADLTTVLTHYITVARGKQVRMSGSLLYDLFMGAALNPRIGRLDLKFFTELRVPWILLFLLTASAAAKQHEIHGTVSWPMILMLVAHGLYTNAVMKGEECVPITWDIFYEKWGWMLIFWNLVGVPFVYCFNAFFILRNGPFEHSTPYTVALFALLLGAYYVWDTAQAQKNHFRMQLSGTYVRRRTFPQLPWSTLKEPRYLTTESGGTLLIDGFWAYARKIHYTADLTMALCWAMSCGFRGVLPYLYPAFFFVMITHRAGRDFRRCAKKYGKDWDRYCEIVPYEFIPFVY